MLKYTSHFITANSVKLHYYRTGGAKPALVLVHGITDDGLCWLRLAQALSDNYDVIMVDARGHGKSDAPSDGYTLKNMATDLASLIEALALKEPVLMGHSMGAITVLTLAGFFPHLPRAILLEDPPPFWMPLDSSQPTMPDENPLQQWMKSLKRKTHSDLLKAARANANWDEMELEPWVDSKHRFSPLLCDLPLFQDVGALDFSILLKNVTCPVLLFNADSERGSIVNEQTIEQLKEWVRQLQSVHISGAGHNIRREQFEAVLSAVNHFLAGL